MVRGHRHLPRIFLEDTISWSTPTKSICLRWKRCASRCLTGSIGSPPRVRKREPFTSMTPIHLADISLPARTMRIISRVRLTNLPAPYFLKLDTHGVEVPIIGGASKTLENTNILVIEAYNFTFGAPAVPFWELCRILVKLGFRPLDVFDILYREVDNAFWQFDLLFGRADLPLFADSRFFIDKRH